MVEYLKPSDVLEETRKKRAQFMLALYQSTGGNEHKTVNMWELGEKLAFGGFGSELTQTIVQYLTGEGLITGKALGGGIGITHFGVKEVEESMLDEKKPTEHFPPLASVNIVHVNNMTNSQIQQNSPNSVQSQTITEAKMAELSEIIKALNTIISREKIDPRIKSNLEAEVQTVQAQMKSSQPRLRTIAESLTSIKQMLSDSKEIAVIVTPVIARIALWLMGIPS